jgi:tetratricopeptide (TPR) repeat protein
MNDTRELRAGITGLIAFVGVEEEMLLASLPDGRREEGSPERWAATPLIGHNSEFKRQQVQRLEAVRKGVSPPSFAEIDHKDEQLYGRFVAMSDEVVAQQCRLGTRALIEEMWAVSDEDLCDPSRNLFLAGRELWLQVVVRGFWHPSGHLGDYYISHGREAEAIRLQERAVATGALLCVPAPAQAMALYNLACAQARAKRPGAAVESLREALELNDQLRTNAARDFDLACLRQAGLLEYLLGAQ